jgi:predicted metal-dependent phosphoesterase TrpH
MRFIDGVEISVTWRPEPAHKGTTIHMVGLRIDPADPVLLAGLQKIRTGRDTRAEAMARDLEIAGIPGALEGAQKFAVNPELLSRTHFARFLVETGKARNTHQAFHHFLTEGKPGYVAHQWATLAEAVGWIQAAGGTPVVAHPGRYKLSAPHMAQFFDEFKALGGAAIEVMTGSHTTDQYNHFAEVARCYGFMASRGSDYHGPGESRVDPGQLPPLPADLTPVWHDW